MAKPETASSVVLNAPTAGEARPGYKHTKLGWIPEEWEVKLLDDVAKRGSGHTPNKSTPEYHNGGIKWISLTDSPRFDNGLISETKYEVSEQGLANSSAVLHPAGTVVLSRDADVGKSAVLGCNMAVSQHFMTWTCDERLDNWFLYYTLQYRKQEFQRIAIGSTIKTIGLPYFKKFTVIYPPVTEQRRIAAVLGAWDRAIATTQQLLAAQQQRKQGLMQELLTGRRRFKGFEPEVGTRYKKSKIGLVPSDWKVAHAGDAFRNVSVRGTSGALLAVTQDQGIVRREDLDRRVVMPEGSTDGYKAIAPGDFVISLRTFQGGIEWSTVAGLVSPAYTVLRLKDGNFLPEFVALYFKSDVFIQRLSNAVVGIRDGKNISFPDFKIQHLPQPPLEEQKHIATAINAALQLELEYRAHLDHFTTQKRGLMQQLLTGAVRVK